MKVYISGKITGLKNFAEIFKEKEIELINLGYEVINPVNLNHDHNKTWESYMKVCIKDLCDCDMIYMLKNWDQSKGAKIEKQIAEYLSIEVIYQ